MKTSVCIATYNGAKYIREQLDSILSQISESDEVIISDDYSTDQTVSLINEIEDKRITVVRNDTQRHGCIGNFENALRHASGDYIFLSDQDDVWLPNKYVIQLKYLKDYDVVVSDSVVTDAHLNPIIKSFFSGMNSGPGIIKNIIRSTYYGSCMAFNRRILSYSLPFPKTQEIGHDLWIGLIGEIIGTVKFINVPLILYRRHESTATAIDGSFARGNRPIRKKIRGRLVMLKELFKFLIKYNFKL